MIKIIDKPTNLIWKEINRINKCRINARYFWFKHPDKYKQNYKKQNNKGLKLKKCACGCGGLSLRTWKTGHNLKINPMPENLGKFLGNGNNFITGKNHHFWKGGKRLTKDGYLEIYSPNHPNKNYCNYVLEHRLVMEKKIKRYLTKEEIVHHKDRNKLNNKENNLSLVKNQSEHNQHHIKNRDELGRFMSGGVPV